MRVVIPRRTNGVVVTYAQSMITESREADSNHNPKDPAAKRSNGGDDSKRDDFVRRMKVAAIGVPAWLDERIEQKPYAMLGLACVVGA